MESYDNEINYYNEECDSYDMQSTSSSTSDVNQNTEQEAVQMQQLQILDNSLKYTTYIIVGILLSQRVLRIQRCQLLNQTSSNCNVFSIRITSNIIILIALFFFYQLSESLLCAETTSCEQRKSNQINHIASALVLIASSLRFIDLLCNQPSIEDDL